MFHYPVYFYSIAAAMVGKLFSSRVLLLVLGEEKKNTRQL